MSYHFIDEDRMKLRFPIYCKGKFKRFSWSDILIGAKVIAGNEDRMKPEQCTGLRDKNGNLIYEWDIVKFKNDISEVKWCINGFAIDDGVQYLVDDMDIEIIGNIHEKESK